MVSLDPLIAAGLINTLLLGATASFAALRDRRWVWLAALWFLLFAVLAAILVQHRYDGRVEMIAAAVEQIAWASGPLLLNFVRAAVGFRVTLRSAVPHFIVPAAILILGTPLILALSLEPLSPVLLVAFQFIYTAASIAVFVRRPERLDRSLLGFWMPLAALAIVSGIHVAQLIRFSPLGSIYADAVPVLASAVVLVALLLVTALAHLAPPARAKYRRSSMSADEAQALFREARARLQQHRLFTRPDLALGDLAAELGVGVHRLSQALSEGGGTSFNELLTSLRLEEAKRLLVDPRNASVALEPIGMEAGFRSRSAFYASFRKHVGPTPAEYRARGESFMS